ncbi:hypothetical protein TrLO_g11223 [Triparma laevis f. longispina]|uniref:Uncharacterized protein n=1 Tax=Triparma laevis f. longispina TaxID=1714387 RepID=A0A9W7KVN2_9STRA|nr:hypothetical protein TrLO_g11223 [Triparma laevis f. longispina]
MQIGEEFVTGDREVVDKIVAWNEGSKELEEDWQFKGDQAVFGVRVSARIEGVNCPELIVSAVWKREAPSGNWWDIWVLPEVLARLALGWNARARLILYCLTVKLLSKST